VSLGGERAGEPQAALFVRKHPDDVGAPLELLVQALQRVLALRLPQPDGQVLTGLLQGAAVVNPAQLGEAVVVGFARQVVEGVAQELHGAPRPNRAG